MSATGIRTSSVSRVRSEAPQYIETVQWSVARERSQGDGALAFSSTLVVVVMMMMMVVVMVVMAAATIMVMVVMLDYDQLHLFNRRGSGW